MIWFLGVVFCVSRSFIDAFKLQKIKKNALTAGSVWQTRLIELSADISLKSKIILKFTDRITVPVVIGIFRPVIIFPANYFTSLTYHQFESILLHELIHIRRHDFLMNTIQVILENLLFFNPATWWIGGQVRKYREYCCDDTVRKRVANQKNYLEALYKIAEFAFSKQPKAIALFNTKTDLIMRINRMLSNNQKDFSLRPFFAVIIMLVIVSILFSFKSQSTFDSIVEKESEQVQSIEIQPVAINPVVLNAQSEKAIVENETSTRVVRPFPKMQRVALPLKDTIPNKKLEALEKEMELKAEEMEALSEELSREIEEAMEGREAEMEALAHELEEKISKKMEDFELQMEETEELEKMALMEEELAEKLEAMTADLEARLESEEFRETIRNIEAKAMEMEGLENEAEIDAMHKEMKVLQEQLQAQMKEIHIHKEEIMNNVDMQHLRQQMHHLQEEMHKMKPALDELWGEETVELKAQLHKLQEEISRSMEGISKELREQMKLKADEMKELGRQIEEEHKKKKQ